MPLCYFVITFVPLSGKKKLTTKSRKGPDSYREHKGYTKDMNYGN